MDRQTYQDNYITSLRTEIIDMIARRLSPVAKYYGYSEVPLETNIKWRPQVLVLGNYSSGKSTLINELLGTKVQTTGQAPTDDSFTVLTYDDEAEDDSHIRVTEVRDGKFLLNDPEYPFESLKKHGQRFAAHFCLKKINSPFLKNLSLIDTPGMLDSITERDRGYDYQQVIGDLARNADLVLILFDPHKAGTGQEAHRSLRETLPRDTFEDRILFVLNRVDECSSLVDLLRVYGTLCWNLSQMTGRKDIPMIHLTYSPHVGADRFRKETGDPGFLSYLDNQREELKKAILEAPKYQLDHLASFVEMHSERLAHFLEGCISYRKRLQMFRVRFSVTGFLMGLLSGSITALIMMLTGFAGSLELMGIGGGIVAVGVFLIWMTAPFKLMMDRFHRDQLASLDNLTPLETQARKDSWNGVRDLVHKYLSRTRGRFSLGGLRIDYKGVKAVAENGTREIREALNELAAMKKNGGRPLNYMDMDNDDAPDSVIHL